MTESSRLEGRYQRVLPKVTEMGSIISHRIDYDRVGVLKGQRCVFSPLAKLLLFGMFYSSPVTK